MRDLLARIDARELAEWAAFDRLEPFGDEQRPLARIAALICNAASGGKAKATEDDFLPESAGRKAGQSVEDQAKLVVERLKLWRKPSAT